MKSLTRSCRRWRCWPRWRSPRPRQAEDFRVGFVNTDRVFREANTAKAAQAKLEQEFSKREKELNDLGDALKAAVREVRARGAHPVGEPARSSARSS